MKEQSVIERLVNYIRRFANRLEKKLERDIINLLLIILLATAFVLKIEVVFWELTVQVPLIILGAVLYGGYYYFIVASPRILPKKLKWKELQTRISLSALSMSAIIADVLIHEFNTPISYVKLWMAVLVVIGAEALVELLAYLKGKRNNLNKATINRRSKRVRRHTLTNRPATRRRLRKPTTNH